MWKFYYGSKVKNHKIEEIHFMEHWVLIRQILIVNFRN